MTGTRTLFVGGRELGARCLAFLAQTTTVSCVLARHDELSLGTPSRPTVISIAQERELPWLAPTAESLSRGDTAAWVAERSPEIGFCVMFPSLIPAGLLGIPPRGIFNLHGAPLPEYRGCLGHAWAIINGENEYGTTMHRMTERLDDGPIVRTRRFSIVPNETGASLHEKAVEAAFSLFVESLPRLLCGDVIELPQEERVARRYRKSAPFDRVIQWAWTTSEICTFLRAMRFPGVPEPHTFLGGRRVCVLAARPSRQDHRHLGSRLPGTVVSVDNDGAVVATGDGSLVLESVRLQPPESTERLSGPGLTSILSPGTRLGT